MKKQFSISIFLSLLLASCVHDQDTEEMSHESDYTQYANFYDVSIYKGFKHVRIFDAWDKKKPAQQWLLVPLSKQIPDSVPVNLQVLRTPLKRLAVLSGTHIAFLQKLDELDRVVGVSDFRLVKNQRLKQRINNKDIREIGINNVFKEEQLLAADVDAVLVSPYENQSYDKLHSLGITVIPVADYLESHPLGRAEWIRFLGLLTGKEQRADSIFSSIADKYESLAKKVAHVSQKPAIFSGKPYGGIWYQPDGASYVARIFKDAGADYLWKDRKQPGGIALDFESVYSKAAHADFWRLVVKSNDNYTSDMLLSEDQRFADFKAFKTGNVLVCNVSKASYYEVAPTEPHVVLADLVHLLHEDLLPGHQPVYYHKISQ